MVAETCFVDSGDGPGVTVGPRKVLIARFYETWSNTVSPNRFIYMSKTDQESCHATGLSQDLDYLLRNM